MRLLRGYTAAGNHAHYVRPGDPTTALCGVWVTGGLASEEQVVRAARLPLCMVCEDEASRG